MSNLHKYRFYIVIVIIFLSATVPILIISNNSKPASKFFNVRARQYSYDPSTITVNQGDTVHIRLTTLDVVHGFFLEGYGINVHIFPAAPVMRLRDENELEGYRPIDEILFVADKFGKFRIRCSHTCGSLHPFMQGDFIVGPNYPFAAGVGIGVGILLAGCFLFMVGMRHSQKRDYL